MESIRISDCTLKQSGDKMPLSFREKLELCKLIDKLNVSMIELPPIEKVKVDSLLIKSVCSAVRSAGVAVPVKLDPESVRITWEALRTFPRPRLQVAAPVSSVQMEYLIHRKPDALVKVLCDTIRACRELTGDVEFIAEDATRADASFLRRAVAEAVSAGAGTVTLCDSAGNTLPQETGPFFASLIADIPALSGVTLGFSCSNMLSLADAGAVAAIRGGVREIKAAACRDDSVSLANIASVIASRGPALGGTCSINMPQLRRITGQISTLCRAAVDRSVPFDRKGISGDSDIMLSAHDTREEVMAAAAGLGYDLSAEDAEKVWNVFRSVADKKGRLTLHELDAIIAAEAMQVPPVYTVSSYVINAGNTVGAMAHMKLLFHGRELEGIAAGDGSIDAAFRSIEQATGRHFELDDFQIQAVAEGREAMGETLVKLRSEGKLYSGRGISTDIIGSGIMAYINALNKIAYEEEE